MCRATNDRRCKIDKCFCKVKPLGISRRLLKVSSFRFPHQLTIALKFLPNERNIRTHSNCAISLFGNKLVLNFHAWTTTRSVRNKSFKAIYANLMGIRTIKYYISNNKVDEQNNMNHFEARIALLRIA